ncbi:hypothetical protein K503DRAFT_771158 [Rhizopogon vinicolor AM-OR11-026]|uniref:HAT C-terminal dimerisation domain-containing protein n=1 Tax=Rhizopogon vinicolor AM-OR11-026 TaxID=1314800 RepID=A0A1B7MYV6_9AGAM|nr:hypothetical protein K503DRAFT_771158 [Rhizopogon vinicolor AM-OR11-026]
MKRPRDNLKIDHGFKDGLRPCALIYKIARDSRRIVNAQILSECTKVFIFSICANSTSCERLFGLFGLILSRLRSRLALKKMLDLAELRLHLRDECTRRRSVKVQHS